MFSSVQFSSVTHLCPTLCDPMNHSTPGLPVHHQLPEFTQTHVHRVSDAIQPPHPQSSPSPSAPNPSQYQSLFQWVSSSHEVAKVLEFQLQHHSLQRNPRADLLQEGCLSYLIKDYFLIFRRNKSKSVNYVTWTRNQSFSASWYNKLVYIQHCTGLRCST